MKNIQMPSMYMCMKNIIKKIVIILCFILMLFLADDCSSSLFHDKQNPCTKGEYGNSVECDQWKKNFPKEYKHYIERLNKRNK